MLYSSTRREDTDPTATGYKGWDIRNVVYQGLVINDWIGRRYEKALTVIKCSLDLGATLAEALANHSPDRPDHLAKPLLSRCYLISTTTL